MTIQHQPNHRLSISEMSADEVEQLISEIRLRREASIKAYAKALAAAKLVKDERLRVKLEQKIKMFDKTLTSVDKFIVKLEKYAVEIRCLELEIDE